MFLHKDEHKYQSAHRYSISRTQLHQSFASNKFSLISHFSLELSFSEFLYLILFCRKHAQFLIFFNSNCNNNIIVILIIIVAESCICTGKTTAPQNANELQSDSKACTRKCKFYDILHHFISIHVSVLRFNIANCYSENKHKNLGHMFKNRNMYIFVANLKSY